MLIENRAGWAGTLDRFVSESAESVLSHLIQHHNATMRGSVNEQQKLAWTEEIKVLKDAFNHLSKNSSDTQIILEYEIPRERGRKPDVVILTGDKLLILEFKSGKVVTEADIDQANFYARDLASYHSIASQLHIEFCVVATKSSSDHPNVISSVNLQEWLGTRLSNYPGVDLNRWLNGVYEPLPELVEAARQIFNDQPLPSIKTAQSAGIPEALEKLVKLARNAERDRSHVLVIVQGCPGAGKTLLGLEFVHRNKNLSKRSDALFLSGNGPLVRVLQDALGSRIFIQDLHGFLREYDQQNVTPHEHLFIFDEAQRAWDAEQVGNKRKIFRSEPESFLKIGSHLDWSVMVALLGHGQEIYKGEEGGIAQWKDAINASETAWQVVCPPELSNLFQTVATTTTSHKLNLNQSLRCHQATNLHLWVSAVLNGDIETAQELSDTLRSSSFRMYITRDLARGKRYIESLYALMDSKRYGLITSSEAKYLSRHNLDISYQARRNINYPKWFNEPRFSGVSCCDFNAAATEFECQGLELDMPLIAWARDLLWVNNTWEITGRNSRGIKNRRQLTLNTYRVLLTRGRDGFVVFLPDHPLAATTYSFLKSAGLRDLLEIPQTI